MRRPAPVPEEQDPNAPPMHPIPGVVWALVVPVILVEAALSGGARGFWGGAEAVGWRIDAFRDYGFLGQVWDRMVELGTFPPEHLARFLTYPFVHGNFTHALFVVVFLLAMGKFVGEVFRPWAVLAVFFTAAVAGALAYGTFLDDPVPLVGGFPAVYGMIGAFTYILATRLKTVGRSQARALVLIGFLLGVQFVFGLVSALLDVRIGNDWVAEVAGFLAGFAVSAVVSPGGWARTLARLRQR